MEQSENKWKWTTPCWRFNAIVFEFEGRYDDVRSRTKLERKCMNLGCAWCQTMASGCGDYTSPNLFPYSVSFLMRSSSKKKASRCGSSFRSNDAIETEISLKFTSKASLAGTWLYWRSSWNSRFARPSTYERPGTIPSQVVHASTRTRNSSFREPLNC